MTRKRLLAVFLSIALAAGSLCAPAPAPAAVADWQKGATMVPNGSTDFGSDNFKQSLRNLHDTGANYVALVVPYYQGNTGSTDIQAGGNTRTDASLAAAIDYAHSLGMGVMLKVHVDSWDGSWRAYINPGDRDGWFNAFAGKLVPLAQFSQRSEERR